MNTNQKYVLIGIVVVLVLQMIFFTPFTVIIEGNTYSDHGNIFSPINRVVGDWPVNVQSFVLYWCIIFIFGGIAFYLAKDNKEKKKD